MKKKSNKKQPAKSRKSNFAVKAAYANYQSYGEYVFLFALIIAAAWIRTSELSSYYLTPDDVYDASNSMFSSIIDLLKYNITKDGHPPLARLSLHYILLITNDYMAVRWLMSIIPSLLSIVAFYYIGKKYFSYETGGVLAMLLALSPTLVLVSQTFRQYGLFILFLAISFNYLLACLKSPTAKNMLLYVAFSFIAAFTHYQMMMLICAVAAVITIKLWKEKSHQLYLWIPLNLILIGAIKLYAKAQHDASGLPDVFELLNAQLSPTLWIKQFIAIGTEFMLNNQLTFLLFILFFIGIFKLIKDKEYYLPAIFLALLAINIIAEILNMYPFFTLPRRLIYYFPFFAIFAGIGFKYVIELIKAELNHQQKANYIAPVLALVLLAGITIYYQQNQFLRDKERILYFPLQKQTYELALTKLSQIGENDIIIADGITANYFIYEKGRDIITPLNHRTSKALYEGKKIYFNTNSSWARINTDLQLKILLSDIVSDIDINSVNKIWYISLGWDSSPLASYKLKSATKIHQLKAAQKDQFFKMDVPNNKSLVFYSLTWADFKRFLGVQ